MFLREAKSKPSQSKKLTRFSFLRPGVSFGFVGRNYFLVRVFVYSHKVDVTVFVDFAVSSDTFLPIMMGVVN